MSEIELNISVDGANTLEEDVNLALAEIQSALSSTMVDLGQYMVDALKNRINKDVYDAYTPQTYLRRKDNPHFGTPLDNVMGNSIPLFQTEEKGKIGGRVGIIYSPDGNNSATSADLDPADPYYDADSPYPLKPTNKAVHGDALIRRIETGKGYDWSAPKYAQKKAHTYAKRHGTKSADFPPRPFWTQYLEELIESGGLGKELIMGMLSKGIDIEGNYDEVERDGQDTTFN